MGSDVIFFQALLGSHTWLWVAWARPHRSTPRSEIDRAGVQLQQDSAFVPRAPVHGRQVPAKTVVGEGVSLSELLPADDILYMVRCCVHPIVCRRLSSRFVNQPERGGLSLDPREWLKTKVSGAIKGLHWPTGTSRRCAPPSADPISADAFLQNNKLSHIAP